MGAMTLVYVKLMFRVLLHLLRSQKPPTNSQMAQERGRLENELTDQITKIEYKYQQ